MKFYIFFFLLILSFKSYCQKKTIIGKVIDSTSNLPILGANVNASTQDGHTFKAISDDNGLFSLVNNSFNIVNINITYVGYRSSSVKMAVNTINLDTVYVGVLKLAPIKVMLGEVQVKAEKFLQVKKDTLEYNLALFDFKEFVMTKDALKKIPGLSIIDDQVYYLGEKFENILVDGKTFLFDSKNQLLMNNLPGFAIDKVQIINKGKSNNGSTEKTIAILLKGENQSGGLRECCSF